MAPKKRKLTGDEGAHNKNKTRPAKAPSTERRITRRMATDMSRNAVFGTAELLEAIIVCLPVRDILAVQGVSLQFRDVVASSKQIQEKLFFRICVPKESWDLCEDGDQNGEDIRLLPHSEAHVDTVEESLTPALLCPLALRYPSASKADTVAEKAYWGNCDVATFSLVNLRRHCGSWRNMQLTDPPCETVRVIRGTVGIASTPIQRLAVLRYVEVHIPGGVTLGHVIDGICTHPDTSLHIPDGLGLSGGHTQRKDGQSVDELCKQYQANRGERSVLESLYLRMHLVGMVLPTSDEWAEMRKNGVLY